MSIIINIGSVGSAPALAPITTGIRASQRLITSTSHADTVEISRLGKVLSRAAEESSFRIARTRAIRAEIDAGNYETPERINATVRRLLDVVG